MRAKRLTVALAAIVMMAGLAACSPQATGGGGGGVHPAECPNILRWAVGDSFTSGANGIAGWPSQDPPIPAGKYANLGIGGAVVPQLQAQIEADLAICAPGFQPSQVVFLAGANDMANSHLGLTQMKANIDALAALLSSKGIDFKVVSVLPIPVGADWSTYNGQRLSYNAYLASTYAGQYIDCSTPLLGPGSPWLNPAYAYGDRAHLNEAGFQVLAGCIDAAA